MISSPQRALQRDIMADAFYVHSLLFGDQMQVKQLTLLSFPAPFEGAEVTESQAT